MNWDINNLTFFDKIYFPISFEYLPETIINQQEPEMFLKMYNFIKDKEIDIDINHDEKDNDPYNNKIGTIEDIIFSTGGTYTFNVLKIYLSIRDYR